MKLINTRITHLLILFLGGMNVLCAQTTSFLHYGVEEGLAQSVVRTIEQDDGGNLWIGTMSGLTKYNGREFITYSKKDGLAEDWITASLKDKSGNIWFGHWGGGVSVYNFLNNHIQNVNFEVYSDFKTITCIMQDNNENFWFGTEGAGAFFYDVKNSQVHNLPIKGGLEDERVYALCQDGKGNIWFGTEKGITILDAGADMNLPESYYYPDFNTGQVSCLLPVLNNEIWIGTKETGIRVVGIDERFTTKNLSQVKITTITTENGLSSDYIQSIYKDADQIIWIATVNGGVTQYKPSSLTKGTFKKFSTGQGLNYYTANVVFQDREKNIWIGTDLGLNQYRGDRFLIYDESDGIVNNIVWSIYEDSQNNLWLGTNGGISKISFSVNAESGTSHRVKNYTVDDGLSSNVIFSIHEDAEGSLWFGTVQGGVCRLKKDATGFETFTVDDGLAGNTVYSIASDNEGNVWFATRGGASRYDPVSGVFTNYNSDNGLGGDHVYTIYKDHKGNMWFGLLGGRLSMFNPSDDKAGGNSFKVFEESSGMKHRFILSIAEDQSRKLWFGAYGGGIYRYDGKEFINYSEEQGLSSASPYSIIADDNHNLWIATSRGIDKFGIDSAIFTHYGRNEGFLGVEPNANAICKDKNGNIWFGTIMGAVKLSPKEDNPNLIEPITTVSGLKIFHKESEFPEDGIFRYDENHITFSFIGICLTNPEKVRYKYRLKPFDDEWSPVTEKNEAVYANLPHGEYTFMVIAANNNGVWNDQPVTYHFIVETPFWKTWWFFGVYILFVMGCFYIYVKFRTRSLKQAKLELEEKVRKRTIQLAQKNKELGTKNKDITDSIRYAKRIQEAILPAAKITSEYLKDSFVLYLPKDIVSGDFFWIDQQGKKLIIAAVDCTGHGVPGAFMSIVGYNMLNKVIKEEGVNTPAVALNTISKHIDESLNTKDDEISDGMDIALCYIDFDTYELQYAGAYNPLYLMRNNELMETKGDKIPIGVHDYKKAKFTNHRIKLEKGDVLYLFSDGYADQFGGEHGKKLTTTRFKKLLLNIHKHDMRKQRKLLEEALENWQGNEEQIDDILIIGLSI